MLYTPETISDASERRQLPKMPSRGIVVVDANSYNLDQLDELVGNLSLMFEVGVLVIGNETRPFNKRINVQYVAQGDRKFADIVCEVQPDMVITAANYNVATLTKITPEEEVMRNRTTYENRRNDFNASNEGARKHRYTFSKNMTVGKGEKKKIEWVGFGYKVNSKRFNKKGEEKKVGNVVRSARAMSPWHMVTNRDEAIRPAITSEIVNIQENVASRIERLRKSGNYAHIAPIDARWNGTVHTDVESEQLLGVRGVVERAMNEGSSRPADEDMMTTQDKSRSKADFLAEYDVAVGSVGFYAGLIGAIGGHVAAEHKFAVKALTEAAAVLVVAATAVEATVKSERLRELAGKAKKFLSSAMVFGLGVNVGLAVGGVLEMGSELVEAVGTELANENEWNVSELESQPMQDEVIVPQPVAESELIGESAVKQVPEPEMTWARLTAHFEQQIVAEGGVVWVNDQGTASTLDDVSQAQVMAHKALMAGGIDEAASALDVIGKTNSVEDYMQARAAGSIYTGVGN